MHAPALLPALSALLLAGCIGAAGAQGTVRGEGAALTTTAGTAAPAPVILAAAPAPRATTPEARSFARVQGALGYANARIAYTPDARCAVYRATTPEGREYAERLLDETGAAICGV